jgi:hypothetical protein
MWRTTSACGKQGNRQKGAMKVVLRTNNWVEMGWAQSVLSDAGIESEVFDRHASVVEGNISAIPRRLMVADADHIRAEHTLEAARMALDPTDASC